MQNDLGLAILRQQDIAVLCRVAPGKYELLGNPPVFYNSIFPPQNGKPCSTPWEYSTMLEYFIEDAETFFEHGSLEKSVTSGEWQEEGKTDGQSALFAVATVVDGCQLILVRLIRDEYRAKLEILRKARKQLLESRIMECDLREYKNRSRIDGLTKVLNRTTFMEIAQSKLNTIEEKIQKGFNISDPPSILMIDIDNFKRVNDKHGHICGDAVLSIIGKVLQNTLRRNDYVGRYGGEEFIVFITRGTAEQVLKIAEKVRAAIAATNYTCVPQVTLSIGCATYKNGETLDRLIARADDAMYLAKNSGKNKVCAK